MFKQDIIDFDQVRECLDASIDSALKTIGLPAKPTVVTADEAFLSN
jgi:hypothetical protein